MSLLEASGAVPHTYWLQSRARALFYCGLLFLPLASHWFPLLWDGKKTTLSDILFSGTYVLLGVTFTIFSFREYVRLREDSIELSGLWQRKRLPFTAIKGRRRYTEKADPYSKPAQHLVIEPTNSELPRLDIKETDKFDDNFYLWFDSLPDLDAMDGVEQPKTKYANFSLK